MSPYRQTVRTGQLFRWALLALVIVAALVAFFAFGRLIEPLNPNSP